MSDIIVGILESFLGDHKKHSETKGQISFDCPACAADKGLFDSGDGKGNLEINYYKGVFKCWACYQTNDMSGSISKLIKRYGNPKNLTDYILFKPDNIGFETKPKVDVVKLPNGFTPLKYPKILCSDYQGAIKYLKDRGIGLEIISKHNLGYTKVVGKDNGRIIIPSYGPNGLLNYYTGRSFKKKVWPKYHNIDLDKKDIIFNEDLINWDATIYLVEGPFDHLVVPNSIPLLGKYISDKLLISLFMRANASVVIVLDDDAKADISYLNKKLNTCGLYGRVKVVYLPIGYDIAEIHSILGAPGVFKALKKATTISESTDQTVIKLRKS